MIAPVSVAPKLSKRRRTICAIYLCAFFLALAIDQIALYNPSQSYEIPSPLIGWATLLPMSLITYAVHWLSTAQDPTPSKVVLIVSVLTFHGVLLTGWCALDYWFAKDVYLKGHKASYLNVFESAVAIVLLLMMSWAGWVIAIFSGPRTE